MKSKELLDSARRTGVEPDPGAAREFRMAAVSLARHLPDSEGWRNAGAAAARALVALALGDAEDVLRILITPDPHVHDLTWTVACYQIGDLTPSALRDFPDPVEAVATLAACPEETHVAAELVVSSSTGLRWTAMTRTNDVVLFQLPTTDTASDGSGEHPGDLALALRRWREQISRWDEIGDGSDPQAEPSWAPERTVLPPPPPHPYAQAYAPPPAYAPPAYAPVPPPAPAGDARLEQRLGALEGRLSSIESALSAMSAAIEGATSAMLGRDDRVLALEAEVRGASLEAVRHEGELRTQATERLEQAIDVRFRALASYVAQALGRLDLHMEAETAANRRAADDAVHQLVRVEPVVADAVAAGVARFDDRLAHLERALDLRESRATETLVAAVEAKIVDRVESIHDRAVDVARATGVGVSSEVRAVADAVAAVAGAIVARDEATDAALADLGTQMQQSLARVAAVEARMVDAAAGTSGLSGQLERSLERVGAVEALLREATGRSAELERSLERVGAVEALLRESTGRSAELERSLEQVGAVEELLRDLSSRPGVAEVLREATQDLSGRLDRSIERAVQREAVAMRAAAGLAARREGEESREAIDEVRRDIEALRDAVEAQNASVALKVGSMGDALRRSAEAMSGLRVSVDTVVLSQRGELLDAVHDVEDALGHVKALSESVHASLLGAAVDEG